MRLTRPVFRLYGSRDGLTGAHLRLDGANLRLAWSYFRLDGARRLTVVWLTGADFRLAGAIDLTWAVTRLTGIWTCDAGLRSDGARCGNHSGTAFVDVIELLAVVGGFALVLDLRRHRGRAPLAVDCDLGRLRTDGDSATASVIGDAGIVIDDDGAVVDVGNASDVDAIDGAVVVEAVSLPVAAVVAVAGVAEAVVNASVEADVKAPEATVEAPAVAVPAPVAGGPERAVVGRSAPCAGNPIVAGGTPVPVAGGPKVVRGRGFGLVVLREGWGRLVGILDGDGLAFVVELIEGLGILSGQVLIRGRGTCLSRLLLGVLLGGLLGVLLEGLPRSSLGTGGQNPSLRGCESNSGSRLGLGVVCGRQVGIGRIGAGVIGYGCGVGILPVTADCADERGDTERKTQENCGNRSAHTACLLVQPECVNPKLVNVMHFGARARLPDWKYGV